MYSARNRDAMITDDTFQIQDWLRSNGNHDRGGYAEFDYHRRIRPLSPVKRHRIANDGRVPDRRRQLKSMESLLGLSDENLNGKHLCSEAVTRASPDVQDSLDRALMDFEETLALAFQSTTVVPPPRGFANHNLVEGDESNYTKLDNSFESSATTTGSSGYSTKPDHQSSARPSVNTYNELQLIREQMVKSLEIIKDLEEQVKLVPALKAQVSSLSLEKQRLSSELEQRKQSETANGRATGDRHRCLATKEMGVNCVPMCRDVGVTTPAAGTATMATMTHPISVSAADGGCGWCRGRPATAVPAYTQTDAMGPTVTVAASTAATAEASTQSARPATVRTCAVGVTAKPRAYDACATAKPTVKHVGCSADLPDTAADGKRVATPPSVTRAVQTDPQPDKSVGRRDRSTQTDGGPKDITVRPVVATVGRRSNSFHHYTAAGQKEPVTQQPVTSKIPRLKSATPEPNRKVLVRQDTYTKSPTEVCDEQPQPQQPRPVVDDDRDKAKQPPNGPPESDTNFKPIRDDLHKDGPSKEMRGALKVLNDSLKKTSATQLPRAQLKQAIDVVREEWFKATSSGDSGGHRVHDYVHSFASYSPVLLEFIINMTDAAGNTVLHYAISHGNFDVVSAILDTGVCNADLTNDAGYSSVMLVSLAEVENDDELKIIKRLFECGDVNLQAKKHGQTTLMLAVSHGKTEVVKSLLECGADVNKQDEDGSTALMCAAEHGLQEIVHLLLSRPECDVSVTDNDGSTALSIAMEAGHREIGIALYAKQHILSRESSPYALSKTKRSRSANTVTPTNTSSYSHLKKSPSLQPRDYATLRRPC